MNDLVVPGWAVVIISGVGSLILAWMVWLTTMTFTNKQAIAVNSENDKSVQAKFDQIHNDFEKMKTETKEWYFRIEDKIDKFILQRLSEK